MRAIWRGATRPHVVMAFALAMIPPALVLLMLWQYGTDFFYVDGLELNGPVAIAVQDGSFTLGDLFIEFSGHRHAAHLAITALLSWLFHWPTWGEYAAAFITMLGVWWILTALAYRDNRTVWLWLMIAFSALTFQTHQGETWLIPHVMIFQAPLAFLLGFAVFVWGGKSRRTVVMVALIFVLGLFVNTAAVVSLVALPLYMVYAGYRDWRDYALVLLIVGVSLVAYFSASSYELVAETTSKNTFAIPNPIDAAHYVLIYIGGSVALRDLTLATWAGGLLLVTYAIGWGILWRRGRRPAIQHWDMLLVWTLGSTLVTAGGRISWGMESALYERYTVTGMFAWGAWAALWAEVLAGIPSDDPPRPLHALMALGGGAMLTVAMLGYVLTAYLWTPYILEPLFDDVPISAMRDQDACMDEFLFARALRCGYAPNIHWDKLAAYRLAGFRQWPVYNILRDYQAGDGVLVNSPLAWVNQHTRDWLLDGVNVDDMLNIVPHDELTVVAEELAPLPNPPQAVIAADDTATRDDFIAPRPRLWTVDYDSDPTQLDPQTWGIVWDYEAVYGFRVRGWQQAIGHNVAGVTFDDVLTLDGWRIPDELTAPACSTLHLESAWTLAAPTDTEYKLSFVISNADGEGLTRNDRPLHLLTPEWTTGPTYADRRALDIPCDATAGEYPLLLIVYEDGEDGPRSAPIVAPNGDPLGDVYYLTTLTVIPPA